MLPGTVTLAAYADSEDGVQWTRPLHGDSVDFPVPIAEDGAGLASLVGTPVSLRFRLREADLFSFWFDGERS